MSGQIRRIAEFLQRPMNRLFSGETLCGQLFEAFRQMIAEFICNLSALVRLEPEKSAQQRKVKFKFVFGHGCDLAISD